MGDKIEAIKQISGSERNDFLYLEQNDHGTNDGITPLQEGI